MRGWSSRYAGAVVMIAMVRGRDRGPACPRLVKDQAEIMGGMDRVSISPRVGIWPWGFPGVRIQSATRLPGPNRPHESKCIRRLPGTDSAEAETRVNERKLPRSSPAPRFISLDVLINGCNAARAAGLPLHTDYTGTQLGFAVAFLQSNPDLRLVTLDLGANDLFLCGHPTATGCASDTEFNTALEVYGQNLTAILDGDSCGVSGSTRCRHVLLDRLS